MKHDYQLQKTHTYLFYSGQGVTLAPDGTIVENFQVLGRESGLTVGQALETLRVSSPWVKELGYAAGQIYHVEIIP